MMTSFATLVVLLSAVQTPSADSVWHESHVLQDVTADGVADSLALRFVGRDIDALTVSFEIWSGGGRLHSEAWSSRGYFHYPPRGGLRAWTLDAKRDKLSQEWSEFFNESAFASASSIPDRPEGSEPKGPREVISFYLAYDAVLDSLLAQGQDSVLARPAARSAGWAASSDDPRVRDIWAAILRSDPVTFRFHSGGETTSRLSWSPSERRFRRVYSCC